MPHTRTGWQARNRDRLGPFHAWREARRTWSADHGDALGDFVERFLFERAVHSSLIYSIHGEMT
jgi:hypothetical protein